MTDLRYPIGPFQALESYTAEETAELIRQIELAPQELREALRGLTADQLDTPYRPEGWTVRQVVHHLPDSHLNGYARMRLAVTEDEPVISLYDEGRWAELVDARSADVEVSLTLLESLHHRWILFLRSLDDTELNRTYVYPDQGPMTVATGIALYAWHGRHHIAHITSLRERREWI